MGLHYSWFFIWRSFFFGLSEFLHQLLTGQIKQLVEINSSEHEFPEGPLLLQLHL